MARLRNSAADGYEVLTLKGEAAYRMRDLMETFLGMPLAHYAPDDMTTYQVRAAKFLQSRDEWRALLVDNKDVLREVVGEELLYQKEPYLRIARPGKSEDQVGIHRDTHYGASPAEWVLWVPITNATNGAELLILPGSHLQPDEAYPWTQEEAVNCERGSDRHWLGFRYAPKKMSSEVENQCIPVPCRVGEAILFNSACVHGQIANTASWTRASVDIRLVDSKAEIQANRGLHGELYAPLEAT